jgi:hypothetical protein
METVSNSDSKVDAQRVLDDIDKYSPYINTDALRVQKAVIQVTALTTLGNTDRACLILKAVKDQAVNSAYLHTVTTFLASCPAGSL